MKFTGNNSVCLLFGYGQTNMSSQAKRRCDTAAGLYNGKRVGKIYITGILGESMKHYLTNSGIPSEDIIVSPKGLTTAGEVKLFFQLIPKVSTVIAVSSWYHLPRVWLILRSYGINTKLVASWRATALFDILRELPLLMVAVFYPKGFTRIQQ